MKILFNRKSLKIKENYKGSKLFKTTEEDLLSNFYLLFFTFIPQYYKIWQSTILRNNTIPTYLLFHYSGILMIIWNNSYWYCGMGVRKEKNKNKNPKVLSHGFEDYVLRNYILIQIYENIYIYIYFVRISLGVWKFNWKTAPKNPYSWLTI